MDDVKQEVTESAESKSSNTVKTISKKNKRIIIIFVTLAVLIIAVCMIVKISSSRLNEYDMLIYENCKTIQSQMKNPDSLILYDEVVIMKKRDTGTLYSYIKTGGTNSYGAIESDICIFADSYYFGTYDEVRSMSKVYEGYKTAIAGYFEYQHHTEVEPVLFEYIEINVNAVRHKLGLK